MPRRDQYAPPRRQGAERDALILQYRFLPAHVADRLRWHRRFLAVGMDELVSEGMVGLVRAAEQWDERRGVAFSTYAFRSVRNKMTRLLYDSYAIHVPAHAGFRSETDQCRLAAERVWMGISLDEMEYEPFRREMEEKPDLAALANALAKLPDRQRAIVRMRYWRSLTLDQIGEQQRPPITKERVRQILKEAMAELRQFLEKGPE